MLKVRERQSNPVNFAIILSVFLLISVSLIFAKRRSTSVLLDVLNEGKPRDVRSSSHSEFSPKKYLLLVQGRIQTLEIWVHLLTIEMNLSIIYLCYDREIKTLRQKRLRVFSQVNTTWTQGRNILAREAYQFERKRREEFHYWIFSDEDVKLRCSTGFCWAELFDLLNQVSNPVVALRFPGQGEHFCKKNEYVFLTDSYDGMMNCFNRRHISTLMPYVSSGDKFSWWISQALHSRLMRVCFPLSALIPCSIYSENPEHSKYPKGRNFTLENLIFVEAYADLENLMQGINFAVDQFDFTEGPLTLQNLSDMSFHDNCEGKVKRFANWVNGEVVY